MVNMAYSVSKNICRILKANEMSQVCLSKKTDLTLNAIAKFKTGEIPISTVETLKKIADALGV